MGIATKRRDYAAIVKTVYGGAIKILLNNRGSDAVQEAATFVKKWVADMMDNKVSLNQLMLTKSLRSEYKTATPPAHKQLANRITARDPGNAPASGDRLSFIYFKPPAGFKGSQGDRVETPAFMKANGLKPDPEYYIEHQLENPVGQLFSIMIDQLPDARPPVKGWSADPAMQAAERELYAKDYLFKAGKQKGKTTLVSMWGLQDSKVAKAAPVAQTIASRTRAAAATRIVAANRGQTRVDELFADKMLVNELSSQRAKSKRTKK
jgi:hypothetical protein